MTRAARGRMNGIYSYDGVTPVIDAEAFVHPAAAVIGDVIIGPGCYVGPCACLRGDFGRIVMGANSNVQETCVVHSFPNVDVDIAEYGHIGHGAVVHGARIGVNALVGMNAVVMDNAEIGENSIVAAAALVKSETVIPPGSLAAGAPARVVRRLSAEEIDWKRRGTEVYVRLARDAPGKLKPAEPLGAVEPGRRRVTAPDYVPLSEDRRRRTES